jgi:4-hydroxythreonine-4-phosphate dehydrogenase
MASPSPICLTMGEPSGIGGEITLLSWFHHRRQLAAPFFVIDSPERLTGLAVSIGLDMPVVRIDSADQAAAAFSVGLPVLPLTQPVDAVPGHPDAGTAASVIESIERAHSLVSAGAARAMVTNPIQKSTLYGAGFGYPGHTEFLGALAKIDTPTVMMLVIDGLRVVPVSVHESLRAAIEGLTTEAIVTKARIAAIALRDRFGIPAPRMAMAGLNPHAGEDGTLGREELTVIAPAVTLLRAEGWQVDGPRSPDTMFHPAARATYDVAICQYHDQALIPLKTIDYDHGVNVTLGLPFVRTSPDHGTALDIAGTGAAKPNSLVAALNLAAKLARAG